MPSPHLGPCHITPTRAPGFKALCEAFTAVTGDCKPYSITGSLPCIRDLQEAGFDVQTLGFGKLAAYHSNNGEALAVAWSVCVG